MSKIKGVLLLVGVLMCRCATVSHGRSERIHVASDPPGATATLVCDRGVSVVVTTPSTLVLPRSAQSCALTFVQPGYRAEIVPLTRRVSLATGGNAPATALGLVLLGAVAQDDRSSKSIFPSVRRVAATAGALTFGLGVGGFAVDYATGAMYRHEPNDIRVVMRPAVTPSDSSSRR